MPRMGFCGLLISAIIALGISTAANARIDAAQAKLQILNKIDAKTEEIEPIVNKPMNYHELEFHVKRCISSSDDEKEENMVLLEIWEKTLDKRRDKVFYGWMFSSSPAISSMEHPIYDVILLDCES